MLSSSDKRPAAELFEFIGVFLLDYVTRYIGWHGVIHSEHF